MVSTTILAISDDVVLAARQGDDNALYELWDACSPILHNALRFCRPGPTLDADDLIQEAAIVFLGVVQQARATTNGDYSAGDAETFAIALAKTLRWRIYNYIRRERRRRGRALQVDDFTLERALARSAGHATAGGPPGIQIQRALDQLSPRQRAVVDGLYFHDVGVAVLSKTLNVSKQAVTALHRRALIRLRDSLSETNPPAE